MSEFHTAFYKTCHIHKDTEYPLWRKCPKCSKVITYSEEEVTRLLNECWDASRDYTDQIIRISIGLSNFSQPTLPNKTKWFEENKKK